MSVKRIGPGIKRGFMEKKQNIVVEAGETIQFTRGEYSDYEVVVTAKFMRSTNLAEEMKNYVMGISKLLLRDSRLRRDYDLESHINYEGFIHYLQVAGVVEVMDTREIHLGSYGNITRDLRFPAEDLPEELREELEDLIWDDE